MSEVAKCPLCEKYIDVTFGPETCPSCGGRIVDFNVRPEVNSPYYGVGGWLLLLVVGLTIIGPLWNIMTLLKEIAESNRVSAYVPEVETAVKVEVGLTLFLVALSVYVGISLWTKRPGAVFKAKIYLLLLPVISIISIMLTVSILPSMAKEFVIKESMYPLVRTVIYSIVWFIYLNSSQRVAATYGTN